MSDPLPMSSETLYRECPREGCDKGAVFETVNGIRKPPPYKCSVCRGRGFIEVPGYEGNVLAITERGERWRTENVLAKTFAALSEARTFLASIATAQPQGTVEQSEWMIDQAREGLSRSGETERAAS